MRPRPSQPPRTTLLAEYRWLLLGLAAIVVGYVLLAVRESMTLAPSLLVLGYCVLVPAHLWSRYRRDGGE